MTAIRYVTQLSMELDNGNMDELNRIVEPFTELLQLVSALKEHAL